MFNSLKYAKSLEEAGVPREQAEAHVHLITEALDMNFATKQDVQLVAQDMQGLRQDFQILRNEFQKDLQTLEFKFDQKVVQLKDAIIQSEQRITIRLGTIVATSIGAAVALAKFLT